MGDFILWVKLRYTANSSTNQGQRGKFFNKFDWKLNLIGEVNKKGTGQMKLKDNYTLRYVGDDERELRKELKLLRHQN